MSTRSTFMGSKARPVRRAEPPSVSRLSTQCGTLNISQPCRPARPATGKAFHKRLPFSAECVAETVTNCLLRRIFYSDRSIIEICHQWQVQLSFLFLATCHLQSNNSPGVRRLNRTCWNESSSSPYCVGIIPTEPFFREVKKKCHTPTEAKNPLPPSNCHGHICLRRVSQGSGT
jgi:hypothetical protein